MHYRCDKCGGYHADAYAVVGPSISPSMMITKPGEKVGLKTPKTVKNRVRKIDNRTYEASEVRHVTDRASDERVELQIAWQLERRMKHVYCKNCDNKWYSADAVDVKHYFLIAGDNVKCLKCGVEVNISVV